LLALVFIRRPGVLWLSLTGLGLLLLPAFIVSQGGLWLYPRFIIGQMGYILITMLPGRWGLVAAFSTPVALRLLWALGPVNIAPDGFTIAAGMIPMLQLLGSNLLVWWVWHRLLRRSEAADEQLQSRRAAEMQALADRERSATWRTSTRRVHESVLNCINALLAVRSISAASAAEWSAKARAAVDPGWEVDPGSAAPAPAPARGGGAAAPAAPKAVNDAATTQMGTPVTVDAAANDTYPAGSVFSQVSSPANGTVSWNLNGTYTYTPRPGFTGVDTFTYQVCMPAPYQDRCSQATEFITVGEPMPKATPQTQKIGAGSTRPVMYAPVGLSRPAAGSNLRPGSVAIAQAGTGKWANRVVVPGKGTWILTGTQVRFEPAAGFTGQTTIRYRIQDRNGAWAYSTLTAVAPAIPTVITGGW